MIRFLLLHRETKGSNSPKKPSPQKSSAKTPSRTPSPRKSVRKKRKAAKTISRIVLDSTDESDSNVPDDDSDSGKDDEISDKSKKISDNCDNVKPIKHSDDTIEVKSDSLPVLITAPNEVEYFIEIIDYCNTEGNKTSDKEIEEKSKIANPDNKEKTGHKKDNNDEGVKRKNDVKRKNVANSESDDSEYSKELPVEKTPKKRGRKEKRDLKNNRIASTFQRMGLLDMVKVAKKEK